MPSRSEPRGGKPADWSAALGEARAAVEALGQGFLDHPQNDAIRDRIGAGALDAEEYCRQIVRLVFRLLILLILEGRGRPPSNSLCTAEAEGASCEDLWRTMVRRFRRDGGAATERAPLLRSYLFSRMACPDLEDAACESRWLLPAINGLTAASEGERTADVGRLDVAALGTIYEGLLELRPRICLEPRPSFTLEPGPARKRSGSYYTPPELVEELVKSALLPVVRQRLATVKTAEERASAILRLRICDPAAGPGTLLLPAARRLALELARARSERRRPAPDERSRAMDDVIGNCLYAVDKDPVAVDLCKLALWLEASDTRDLSRRLDAHIRCGDALVGVTDPGVLDGDMGETVGVAAGRRACDAWTAAFFVPLTPNPLSQNGRGGFIGLPSPKLGEEPGVRGEVDRLARRYGFFHWPLEFPEVFAEGGFDVVLANPPWELLQPEERPFFRGNGADIDRLKGSDRKAAIRALPSVDPQLWSRWTEHRHDIEAVGRFIRESGRYRAPPGGKLNTYRVFTDTVLAVLHPSGRAACIVPSGLVTDNGTRDLFQELLESGQLVSLYHFDNRERLFPGVGSAITFCLMAITGTAQAGRETGDFAFFLHGARELRDPAKRFSLGREDIALLNPNTRTCPIFRSRDDAERTKSIYRRVPVLVREADGHAPAEDRWDIAMRQGLFNMTSDSHLFRTRQELEESGWTLRGSVFRRADGEVCLPLYEAKMMHQYDHRWARAGPAASADREDGRGVVLPRYWVAGTEVEARLGDHWTNRWALGCRLICRSTDRRTVIATILPYAGYGNSVLLLFPHTAEPTGPACFLAALNSYILDYVARQKLGGVNLNFHILKQLPILPPSCFDAPAGWEPEERLSDWIGRRVLELLYTSHDLVHFAHHLGYTGRPFAWHPERRFQLRSEIEAAMFHLYGVPRSEVDAIMETFPIVRREDERRHGRFRTRDGVLAAYDAMHRGYPHPLLFGHLGRAIALAGSVPGQLTSPPLPPAGEGDL